MKLFFNLILFILLFHNTFSHALIRANSKSITNLFEYCSIENIKEIKHVAEDEYKNELSILNNQINKSQRNLEKINEFKIKLSLLEKEKIKRFTEINSLKNKIKDMEEEHKLALIKIEKRQKKLKKLMNRIEGRFVFRSKKKTEKKLLDSIKDIESIQMQLHELGQIIIKEQEAIDLQTNLIKSSDRKIRTQNRNIDNLVNENKKQSSHNHKFNGYKHLSSWSPKNFTHLNNYVPGEPFTFLIHSLREGTLADEVLKSTIQFSKLGNITLSTSVITNKKCRTFCDDRAFTGSGLILSVYPQNIFASGTSNLNRFKSRGYEMNQRIGLNSLTYIKSNSRTNTHNEIVIEPNNRGKKIAFSAFFVKVKSDGTPSGYYISTARVKALKNLCRKLKMPVVPIYSH